jgi:transposase-like protein
MSILSAPYFHDEKAAYAYVEARLWPNGPVCPKCGETKRVGQLKGASTRIGVHKCYACRKPFTVKVKTIFEDSHVELHLWLQAMFLLSSSKKGISSNHLSRTLGVTLKTAWFMSHRIREAMRDGNLAPFGGEGGPVEVDETFIGRDPAKKVGPGYEHKYKVLSLVDRSTGQARSIVVDKISIASLTPILQENIVAEAHVMTDDAGQYRFLRKHFRAHDVINHTIDEYVRGAIHTNTVEGFFSVFKRGMRGTYQHCAKAHLHRYTAEFDFRYSHRIKLGIDDHARFGFMLDGVKGKRLTYRTTSGRRQAAEG